MVPLEAAGRRFAAGSDALLQDARVVWRGRNLVDDMIRVVQRRAVDSRSASRPGLGFRTKCHATISDVEAFVAGRTNDARIADLIAGLTTLRLTNRRTWPDSGSYRGQVSGSYALIRSAIPCHELPNDGIQLRVDSTTVNYLVNGQLDRSAKHAARTLASFGHRARLHTMIGDRNTSRRLAASLLFPISFQSQQRLLHSITFDSNAQGAAQ
jgi:CRISPR-associated protein Csx17